MTMITGSASDDTAFRFTRNGTAFLLGDSLGSRTRCTFGMTSRDTYELITLHSSAIDSPSSTSALTYRVQARPNFQTFYRNRAEYDVDDANSERGVSTLTLMEFAS